MENTATARCKRHPAAAAGWRCVNCESTLCPECATVKRAQTTEFYACGLCGGGADRLMVHRGDIPYARRLLGAWRYLVQPGTLQVLVGLSVVLAFFEWLGDIGGFLPRMIGRGLFWGSIFAIIRGTARGDRQLEPPDFSDFLSDIVGPAVRGVVATVVVWFPGVFYAIFLAGEDKLGDPIFWVLMLLGITYVPIALLTAAAGSSLLAMLNPLAGFTHMRRLGTDYLLALGALLVLAVPHTLLSMVGGLLRLLDVLMVSRVLAEGLMTVGPFLMAHVLGLLLYVRGDDLGYGMAQDYYEPVLPGVEPLSRPEAFRGSAPAAFVAHAPEPEPTGPVAGPELASLAKAVEARDVPQVLALYATLQSLPDGRKAVEPAHHLFVGQAAASQGDYPLAVRALEAAADVAPDGPTAPRALVMLARVFGERLQEPQRAEELYRYIVHRYPDTDASRFAQQRLPPGGHEL
jgi:hypothetical protein